VGNSFFHVLSFTPFICAFVTLTTFHFCFILSFTFCVSILSWFFFSSFLSLLCPNNWIKYHCNLSINTEHMKMCVRAMELCMCHDRIWTKFLRIFQQQCRWVQTDIR
jgi:hypothetical protein